MASQAFSSLAEKTIYILGPRSMQNELLATFLAESTGARCVTGKDVEAPLREGPNGSLILWDCQGRSAKRIMDEIRRYPLQHQLVLLFNLSQGGVIEKDAVEIGVRGFLYEKESYDSLPRAIQSVCEGELWLSREFMSSWIDATKRGGAIPPGQNGLTPKETQILRLIAQGASNKTIAGKLTISPNTAKTHLYNIFRKINVKNRLQAALWAQRNL